MGKDKLCLHQNLCYFLDTYGIHVSSYWISGVLGTMGFSNENHEVTGMSGSFFVLFERFRALFGDEIKDRRIHIKELLKEVDALTNSMVWINNYYICDSPYYMNNDCYTLVVIQRVCDDMVYFYDKTVKTMEPDLFLKAVQDNEELVIYYADELRFTQSNTEMTKQGLEYTLKNLSYQGNNAIQEMKLYINDFIQKFDTIDLYHQYYQLNRPGGLSSTRNDMAHFFREFGEDEIASIYESLSEQWRMAANLLFRLSTRKDDIELRHRIIQRLWGIYDNEVDGVEKMSDFVRRRF